MFFERNRFIYPVDLRYVVLKRYVVFFKTCSSGLNTGVYTVLYPTDRTNLQGYEGQSQYLQDILDVDLLQEDLKK